MLRKFVFNVFIVIIAVVSSVLQAVSLDEIERLEFNAGAAPMALPSISVVLDNNSCQHPAGSNILSLDDGWKMAEGGNDANRLAEPWNDAIDAVVPGSVHTALLKAGKISDPYIGMNDAAANAYSFKTWWFKKEFAHTANTDRQILVFDGVAASCTVWLNGVYMGRHDGMFGGPIIDVTTYLVEKNTLIVKIEPAVNLVSKDGRPFGLWANVGWIRTVVFNNCYGWHYSNIPALGIWRSVKLEPNPRMIIENPFIATRDAAKGQMDLTLTIRSLVHGITGVLSASIEPENFSGQAYHFNYNVTSPGTLSHLHFDFAINNPQLWWPNGVGKPHLYKLKLSFVPGDGTASSYKEITFGIRTIKMLPLPAGEKPDKYNWTFEINGKPMFVKGTGWCTNDTLMDFSRQRYERFISLAKDQHVQMLRAWGSGMPETDDFYDLCDRYGIMVMQEWPTAWDSQYHQPYNTLEDTVRLNTLRLRNHPSLAIWGGGNESANPYGEAIDMMGKYAIELDGTRAFHRGEPRGGSFHNYDCWWGKQPLDRNLSLAGDFIGEFGLASCPSYESVQKYLPDDEKQLWPAPDDKSFAYHTPVFNRMEDYARLKQYAYLFAKDDCNMQQFIIGSQLSQAVGLRHTLELARTRWPDCTGALSYKLNDNYPAVSWASVDWYGAPKIAHYIVMDSFTPLQGCVLFNKLNIVGEGVSLPVYVLDDANELAGSACQISVRAYNSELKQIRKEIFDNNQPVEKVRKVGEFVLSKEDVNSTPLFIVCDVIAGEKKKARSFYWLKYEAKRRCLFELPKTTLSVAKDQNRVVVKNTGDVPAFMVSVENPGHSDAFTASDNYFWLEAGETKEVTVNNSENIKVLCFNLTEGEKAKSN